MTRHEMTVSSLYELGQIDMEGWDKAFRAVRAIAQANPKDVWPHAPTGHKVSQTAFALCEYLYRHHPAPSVVYQLPDGNIVLEWRMDDGRIRRYEVVEDGTVESMLSYADDREPEFGRFSVAVGRDRFQETSIRCVSDSQRRGGLNGFQLAA
jgi:hypothetical protein